LGADAVHATDLVDLFAAPASFDQKEEAPDEEKAVGRAGVLFARAPAFRLGEFMVRPTAVCTVIEPPLQLVMLLTEKTSWVNASVPVALRFNCAANRCKGFSETHAYNGGR
jgi:hypothetical protein